jgi:nucleoid DNA-binding protein
MVMNRSDLVDAVARKARLSRAAAERAVRAIFDGAGGAIEEGVQAQCAVEIRGFGTFSRGRRRVPGEFHANGEQVYEPVLRFTPAPSPGSEGECDGVVTPEEMAIRRRLIAGFERCRGIEIEDVFPSGWADDQIHS